MQQSDREQEDLRVFVNGKSSFSERERAALQVDSIASFDAFWNQTTKAQAKFESNHEQGVKQWARKAQDFGEAASDTMRQLEPIVQVIKDFGHPFGGMAIGTITFFFTVKLLTPLLRSLTKYS